MTNLHRRILEFLNVCVHPRFSERNFIKNVQVLPASRNGNQKAVMQTEQVHASINGHRHTERNVETLHQHFTFHAL